jgi:hypothetical protein
VTPTELVQLARVIIESSPKHAHTPIVWTAEKDGIIRIYEDRIEVPINWRP